MSFRKSLSRTSGPVFIFQTLLAQFSNSMSCVIPLWSTIGAYAVLPGDRLSALGSPPLLCVITSVVRFRGLIDETPATIFPSHFTLNLKFLYGSRRFGFTVNSGICIAYVIFTFGHIRICDFGFRFLIVDFCLK